MSAALAPSTVPSGTDIARREHAVGSQGAAGLLPKHHALFERAQTACRERHCWSPFPDLSKKYPNSAEAPATGLAAFQAHLGSRFLLDQPGAVDEVGEEVSLYTQEALGIRYRQADIDALFDAAQTAMSSWAVATFETRVGSSFETRTGVLMEVIDTLCRERLFEIAQANLVTMALDTTAEPIGKRLVKHRKTAIVDFTGSVRFGQWVEQNAYPALCFTETAGCNTVVLESADDLDAALRSLATTLCMFSAQMCTSPQNIYVPTLGVKTPQGTVPLDEVARRLADAVAALTTDAKKAAMILLCGGALLRHAIAQACASQRQPIRKFIS